ncbi:hypothetical protein IWX49DRAFT_579538 [Phyllosticta citricarpa]
MVMRRDARCYDKVKKLKSFVGRLFPDCFFFFFFFLLLSFPILTFDFTAARDGVFCAGCAAGLTLTDVIAVRLLGYSYSNLSSQPLIPCLSTRRAASSMFAHARHVRSTKTERANGQYVEKVRTSCDRYLGI